MFQFDLDQISYLVNTFQDFCRFDLFLFLTSNDLERFLTITAKA